MKVEIYSEVYSNNVISYYFYRSDIFYLTDRLLHADLSKEAIIMKLYTKTICPKCLWVKAEIERAGLQAEIINIDKDADALALLQQKGYMSVPVLEVDGSWYHDQKEMVQAVQLMHA